MPGSDTYGSSFSQFCICIKLRYVVLIVRDQIPHSDALESLLYLGKYVTEGHVFVLYLFVDVCCVR